VAVVALVLNLNLNFLKSLGGFLSDTIGYCQLVKSRTKRRHESHDTRSETRPRGDQSPDHEIIYEYGALLD